MPLPEAFLSSRTRAEVSTMKYAAWAEHLTEDQLAAVLWAAGEVATRIDEHGQVSPTPFLVSHVRVNIGLTAIRRAVTSRPLTVAELKKAIRDGALEPLEPGASVHEADAGADGAELKSARWAERLAHDQFLGLLWAIGEMGIRVDKGAELDPSHLHGDRVRANLGLSALCSAARGKPLSVEDLEEAFRAGKMPAAAR